MIDPNLQTETDRQVRAHYISLGIIIPLEHVTAWDLCRARMATVKANIARMKEEWADGEGDQAKERRYGRS